MENPPSLFIDSLKSPSIEPLVVSYDKCVANRPTCRLCKEYLCDIGEKMKHVVISCTCGRLYCHVKCADEVLAEPSCYVCKSYYIYESKNSCLQTTIAGH